MAEINKIQFRRGSNISNAYKIPVPLTFFPYGGLYFKYTNLNRFESGTLNRNPIKKINYIVLIPLFKNCFSLL